MMDIDWLRKILLPLPGVTEHIQWEIDLVFKVRGKMFAVAPLEPTPLSLSFKCSNDDFAELIERPGVIPAPYLARAHWVALESESTLPRPELERLLRQAHSLVVAKLPKKLQANLLAPKPKPRKGQPKPSAKRSRTRQPTC
jgi:predicted DNA-binding protein (MmcQ/YjbR family)